MRHKLTSDELEWSVAKPSKVKICPLVNFPTCILKLMPLGWWRHYATTNVNYVCCHLWWGAEKERSSIRHSPQKGHMDVRIHSKSRSNNIFSRGRVSLLGHAIFLGTMAKVRNFSAQSTSNATPLWPFPMLKSPGDRITPVGHLTH